MKILFSPWLIQLHPDFPKMGWLLPKMLLLSQRIPGGRRKVIGFGNSSRITSNLLSPLFSKLPNTVSNPKVQYTTIIVDCSGGLILGGKTESFKIWSLQYFSSGRFKTKSKLEEWGMLRANEPCDLINPRPTSQPPKVQRHFTFHFERTISLQ